MSSMTYVFAHLISKPAQDKETGFYKQGWMLNNSQMAIEVAPDPHASFQLMQATCNTAEVKQNVVFPWTFEQDHPVCSAKNYWRVLVIGILITQI